MLNFYISEILILPDTNDLTESSSTLLKNIKQAILVYLEEKNNDNFNFQKSNVLWYNSELANFKIDLARQIIEETQYGNWETSNTRVLVLLNFENATLEAQNALLKLIEEPPINTLIILPIVNEHRLLSTINSRCLKNQLIIENSAKKQDEKKHQWPSSLAEVFFLVKENQDREVAKKFIKSFLKQKQLNYQQKKALSQAYLDLEANQNVRLALEHCFFSTF